MVHYYSQEKWSSSLATSQVTIFKMLFFGLASYIFYWSRKLFFQLLFFFVFSNNPSTIAFAAILEGRGSLPWVTGTLKALCIPNVMR